MRQKLILELLSKRDYVEIDMLANETSVSSMTIRRDLEKLEKAGLLTRTYGGAINFPLKYNPQPSFQQKEIVNRKEKIAIGIEAVKLIDKDDIIGIGAGTTCHQIAMNFNPLHKVVIVTNAINIAIAFDGRKNIELHLSGGMLLENSFSLGGPAAEEMVSKIHINKLFLGATGVSYQYGVTSQNLLEVAFFRKMIDVTQELIIVADSSKFEMVTLAPIVDLNKVDTIITDQKASPYYIEKIEKLGVKVIIASEIDVGEKYV